MNYKIFVLLSLSLTLNNLKAQKYTPCLVTTQTGTAIEGNIKRYKPGNGLTKGFTLYNDQKQKMKINPAYAKQVVVGNDTFVSHTNQKGKPVFMQQVAAGPKANLYRYSITVTSGIPGEGLTSWYINEHYLERDGEIRFVDEGQLLQNPENYFPNAAHLTDIIKSKKKKEIDLVEWVKIYNTEE